MVRERGHRVVGRVFVVAFRTVWGILVPLTVVLMSGLWTLGIMVATGKAVDVLTVVLPPSCLWSAFPTWCTC